MYLFKIVFLLYHSSTHSLAHPFVPTIKSKSKPGHDKLYYKKLPFLGCLLKLNNGILFLSKETITKSKTPNKTSWSSKSKD